MQGTLLLTILSIASSYTREAEVPVEDGDGVPDTIQWWFGNGDCWRIRTYASDHDVHAYSIENSSSVTLDFAMSNNRKHYGDVFRSEYTVRFADCTKVSERESAFGQLGLEP